MADKELELQALQSRVKELERQLAEAQTVIHAIQADQGHKVPVDPWQDGPGLLSASEDVLQRAFEVAPYPLMIWREDGRMVMVNSAFTEITGYTLTEVPDIGQWAQKAFGRHPHPSLGIDEGAFQENMKKWREFEITTRSGATRIWDFSNAALGRADTGQRLMITMAVDITERRQIEEQMQENEEKFSIIFEKAPFAAALSRLPGGVFVNINEEFERVFGYTRQEVIGRTSLELGIHPDVEARTRISAEIQSHGSARNIEARLYSRSGDARIFLLNIDMVSIGAQKYALQTAQDITERKQAEEALQEKNRQHQEMARLLELDRSRLSTILEHLPVGVWIGDQEGRLINKNKEADRIWASEAPLLGQIEEYQQYQAWYPGSGIPLKAEEYPMALALRTGQPVDPVELDILRFDGSEGTVLVSAVPIKDGQGRLSGVVAVNVDITDRKRAEQERRLAEERYATLFNLVQEGFAHYRAIFNDQGGVHDIQVMEINPAGATLSGVPREDQVGKTWRQIWPGVSEDLIGMYQRVEETGQTLHFDDHNNITGRIYDVTIFRIRPGEFIATFNDITERRNTEDALRQSEERFSKAFHSSPDALIISRMSDGFILEVNEGWNKIFGHEPSEVVGRTSIDLGVYAIPEDREKAIALMKKNGALRDFEIKIRRKSGEIRQASMSVERIEMNGTDYLLTIMRDITERKQAEEHIAYQARLLASVNDAIVGSDAEYRITAWNAAAEAIYGWKAEEALGRNGLEILQTRWPQEDAEEMRRRIAETGSWRGEATQLHKNGTLIPVEVSSMVLRDEQGKVTGYVSVNRDITERKRVEKALRASEAKMRAVFRALTEGVVFLNREGVVEEANDAVQLTHGHTLQELSDAELDPRSRIIRPDGTPFPVEEQPAMVALRTGKTVQDVEMGVPTRDGSLRWRLVNAQPVLDDDGTLLGAVASFFDITERKQAEQALRESEKRFRSLADSMPQLVWTALPDGRVDYYNERHREYLQITQRLGDDWDWAPVLHPDDTQATVDAWLHSVETGEVYQIEHRVRMADGSYRWHLSRGVPMLDEKGRVIRWFGTATDIHDLKLAEEQLKVYADRLERSNRELEQFAFMASHDLQEPLRKIEMFGDLLVERAASLQEHERNYVDRMRKSAGRMRDMVEGLLQISRIATQGKPFVSVDLSQVTAEVLSDFEGQIQHSGARLEVGPLPFVSGDPMQLRQLMQNLIGNALKYHRPGRPPEVQVSARLLEDKAQIEVEDQGIGFDNEDADRIFEPFQRLVGRNQYEGSGIGLAICRRIVERHGGEIAALSERGAGTKFIVTLPIQQPNDMEGESRKDGNDEDPGPTPGS